MSPTQKFIANFWKQQREAGRAKVLDKLPQPPFGAEYMGIMPKEGRNCHIRKSFLAEQIENMTEQLHLGVDRNVERFLLKKLSESALLVSILESFISLEVEQAFSDELEGDYGWILTRGWGVYRVPSSAGYTETEEDRLLAMTSNMVAH